MKTIKIEVEAVLLSDVESTIAAYDRKIAYLIEEGSTKDRQFGDRERQLMDELDATTNDLKAEQEAADGIMKIIGLDPLKIRSENGTINLYEVGQAVYNGIHVQVGMEALYKGVQAEPKTIQPSDPIETFKLEYQANMPDVASFEEALSLTARERLRQKLKYLDGSHKINALAELAVSYIASAIGVPASARRSLDAFKSSVIKRNGQFSVDDYMEKLNGLSRSEKIKRAAALLIADLEKNHCEGDGTND